MLLMRRDRPEEARVLLEGALRITREHELTALLLRSTNNLLVVFDQLDRIAESLPLQLEACDVARRAGDERWLAILQGGVVSTLVLVGRWTEALERFADLQQSLNTAFLENIVIDVVLMHCERGDVALARSLFDGFARLVDADDSQAFAGYNMGQAAVLRAEGDLEGAQRSADAVLRLHERLGMTSAVVKAVAAEAFETAFARRDERRIDELLAMIDALRPGERTLWWRAMRARYGARLAALQGQPADAELAEAARLYDELSYVFAAACVRLEHAEWLVTVGRADEAAALLDQAHATFVELGARPWLERAERVPAATGAEVTA
jgi:hypothetical protein